MSWIWTEWQTQPTNSPMHSWETEKVAKISQALNDWGNWRTKLSLGSIKRSHPMQRSCGQRPWRGQRLQLQVSMQRTEYCREVQPPTGTGTHQRLRQQPAVHGTYVPWCHIPNATRICELDKNLEKKHILWQAPYIGAGKSILREFKCWIKSEVAGLLKQTTRQKQRKTKTISSQIKQSYCKKIKRLIEV